MEIRKLDTNLASSDMRDLTFHLLNDDLFLPDVLRELKALMDSLKRVFALSPEPYGIYVDGELAGLILITDIVLGHEARFYLWLWGKGAATHQCVKWLRDYLDYMSNLYGIQRIVTCVAKQEWCRFLEKFLRFKTEARMKHGYKHRGQLHTLFQLRWLSVEG